MSTTQANVAGALSTASLSRQLAEVKADVTMAVQQLASSSGSDAPGQQVQVGVVQLLCDNTFPITSM